MRSIGHSITPNIRRMNIKYLMYVFACMCALVTSTAWSDEIVSGVSYRASFIKAYDGDTFHLRMTSSGVEFIARPMGYDSAEIRAATNSEKQAAIRARDAVEKILTSGEVTFEWSGRTSYRTRFLVDVWVDGIPLDQLMVLDGMQDQRTRNRPLHSRPWLHRQTRRQPWPLNR